MFSQHRSRLNWTVVLIVLVTASCGDQDGTAADDVESTQVVESTVAEAADTTDLTTVVVDGQDEGEQSKASSTSTADGSVDDDSADQQPSDTAPAGLLDQELAILGSSRAEVEEAVEKFDGVITVEVAATSTFQVSFPVESFDELIAIRKELEAAGFSIALIGTNDS